MSFTIRKIELSNIRSHTFFRFIPAETGVTAISGQNGSGKSTIVDSAAWVIYGTKPAGVSRVAAIVRDGIDFKQDKVFARIYINIDNTELKIERRILTKGGAVECDVWERKAGEDEFKHIAGSSVSHAERYLRKRLKMDEKGFLAAVLVQQKQVDQLISSSPRERAEVIEKLTGISSITAALVEARQQYNSMKKALTFTEVDDKEITRLKSEIKQKTGKLEEIEAKKTKSEKTLEENEVNVASATTLLEAAEAREVLMTELKERVVALEASLKSAEGELERLTKMKDAKKKQLSSSSTKFSLQEIEERLSKARADNRAADRALDGLNEKRKQGCTLLEDIEGLIRDSKHESSETASNELESSQFELSKLNEDFERLSTTNHGIQSEMKSLMSAIKVIDSHDGSCPTCLQKVDDKTSAIGKLKEAGKSLKKDFDSNAVTLEENRTKTLEVEENISKLSKLVEAFSKVTSVKEQLKMIDEKISDVTAQQLALEKTLKEIERSHASAKRYADIKSEYDELLQEAVNSSDNIESYRKDIANAQEELDRAKNDSKGSITTLRKKLSTVTDARNKALLEASKHREESSVLSNDLLHLRENLERAEEELSKYNLLRVNVETIGASVEVIDEFRSERIKNSVPVVSTYASDLLSRFTEGKFTQLRLDEKFNAVVTLSNGTERAIGLLSGGELSAAAISLRLAISMLLNPGSTQTTMILDEVLVSQDVARAEQILGTIKEVCKGQIIMISHGPYTNEIADEVIEL